MNPSNPQSIGESAIPQPVQQAVAPDAQSPFQQGQLFGKSVQANKAKPVLDTLLKKIADSLGASTSSRVKNIETAAAKVAQKRLQKRDYDIHDINDVLGARIVLKSKSDLDKAKEAIKSLVKAGLFSIDKQEPVKNDTYSAYHIDGTFMRTPTEIQIMDKKQEAESLINHGLRAIHGEKPQSKAVETLRNKQADIISKMPDEKLTAVSNAVKGLNAQAKGKPLDPRVTAGILTSVQ